MPRRLPISGKRTRTSSRTSTDVFGWDPSVAEYKLPGGGPSPRGMSLDKDTPYREGLTAFFVAHMFYMERAPERRLTAARVEHIEQGLSRQIRDRAKKCQVTLKRVDAGNLRWIFAVDSGKGPKVVRLKATRLGKVVRLTKMDLHFACSCPSWQWQGPEYHAKQEGYIDGKPRGTASAPNVADPEHENRVCKHVAAVLDFVRKWEVPPPK